MPSSTVVGVRHVVRGRLVEGADVEYPSSDGGSGFATPPLDLAELVWPRTEPLPAADVPISEVVDFLVATGERLDFDTNPYLAEAFRATSAVNVLGANVLEHLYRALAGSFSRQFLELEVEQNLGPDPDGWRAQTLPDGRAFHVRPFPSRMVHYLAGNAPGVAASSITRAALSRGVSLLKLPSNDLFSAPAILATMALVDEKHPVLQSFSAVYWRGGDAAVESALFRPQYFDKIVAWGGDAAMRSVQRYLGPGLELVANDPKNSVSLIGREAFESNDTLRAVAALAASDVGHQEFCQDSRFQFVEGPVEDADRYGEALLDALHAHAAAWDNSGRRTPVEIRDEVEVLAELEPIYRVWGGFGGDGLVVRSDQPLDLYPIARTVNIVPVPDLRDAMRYVNVSTATAGVYPAARKPELRDLLGGAGAQRVVTLGGLGSHSSLGRPHDGFYPLQRLVRWLVDED